MLANGSGIRMLEMLGGLLGIRRIVEKLQDYVVLRRVHQRVHQVRFTESSSCICTGVSATADPREDTPRWRARLGQPEPLSARFSHCFGHIA